MIRDLLLRELVQKLNGTEEAEVIDFIDEAYSNLENIQNEWIKITDFRCPEGCGSCCHNFEPDLYESEILYMAAWIIAHNKEFADKLVYGEKYRFFEVCEEHGISDDTCIFFDKDKDYHCSIYEGRGFVCRLFGACSARDKQGELCWKPCKFYPEQRLASYKIPLTHRQYSRQEAEAAFSIMPPAMSDIFEPVLNRFPSKTEVVPLREGLPKAIGRLYWIMSLNQ